VTNYGNRTGFVKSVWLSEAKAAGADYAGFSEKPNTFSFFVRNSECNSPRARLHNATLQRKLLNPATLVPGTKNA
jgi:hypothetical protein